MKKLIFLQYILFSFLFANAQNKIQRQTSLYDAANWHTRHLDEPQKIKVEAPPGAAQTKVELQKAKKGLAELNDSTVAKIEFWNACAPSYRWNQIVHDLAAQNFQVMLRFPASWMNIAIYDATVLAWKEKIKYKRIRPVQLDPTLKTVVNSPTTYSYPCEHTVTAAAAANMLAYFFPAKRDSIMLMARAAAQSRVNAGVQFESDMKAGWKIGEEVALQIIEKAKNDGSANVWDGTMNKDPKKWTGTYPLGITLTKFTPLVIRSADQFRPPPPPDFEEEMKEMKQFKQTSKTTYTAFYWAHNGNVWNDLVAQKIFEYGLCNDAPAVARIYTVLTTASHDVAIAIMDAKYAYWGIRPSQYDTTYKPLISTPPFPGYPSGHAAGSATQSAVLEYFFPANAKQFQKLAKECADSRFYAGIHFRSDNDVALQMGAEVGKYIVETWMQKDASLKKLSRVNERK